MAPEIKPINAVIGERLKIFRTNLGMTQDDFAETVNMSSPAYGAVERGRTSVGIELLFALERRHGLHADFVLYGLEVPRHDVAAFEVFQRAFLTSLSDEGLVLSPAKAAELCTNWYREYLNGKELPLSAALIAARLSVSVEKRRGG